MATLYLLEQGAVLRKTGDRLIVEKEGAQLLEVECRNLHAVLIFGNVQVTTQALAELLDHGIELALLSQDARLRGQLTPPAGKNISLRLAQYRLYDAPDRRLAFARTIVHAKLQNAANVLRRFNKNHPDPARAQAADNLDRDAQSALAAPSLEPLLGIEGSAARAYFAAFGSMLRGPLGFTGRSSRPPRDPVNALLSLGYTLVGNELTSLLDAVGFDPFLGFYHQVQYGRPSLALDLLELFRHPLVDRFVVSLLNLGKIQGEHFQPPHPEHGVLLNRTGQQIFFLDWERWLTQPFREPGGAGEVCWRSLLRREADRLAAHLRAQVPYQPFLYRRPLEGPTAGQTSCTSSSPTTSPTTNDAPT